MLEWLIVISTAESAFNRGAQTQQTSDQGNAGRQCDDDNADDGGAFVARLDQEIQLQQGQRPRPARRNERHGANVSRGGDKA
jgi:hypothetical protein